MYTLIGPDGRPRPSALPGTLGGHRRTRVYGRLDCPGALRWIARGHYVAHRVFFADEATALAAGYRPCGTCLRDRHREWKTGRMDVRIPMRPPFDHAHLLGFLAARAVPGVETVRGQSLQRDGYCVRFADDHVLVEGADADAVRRVRAVVDADADPAVLLDALGDDPHVGPLVRARPGLRCPGAFDAYEVAVRAIVGQQVSVAGARTVLGRMAAAGLFPRREGLAAARAEDLPMPAVRARALIALAQGAPLDAIKGVGPWTRAYVALRCGDRDVLLDGDLIVRRVAARLGAPGEARALSAHGERWSPWRSYVTHHLWAVA